MRPWDEIAQRREIAGTEIEALRTYTSKTFDMGGGCKKLIQSFGPLHYPLNGKLLDIDLTPRDDGDAWVIDRAPYIVRIDKTKPRVTYEGRVSGQRVEFTYPATGRAEFDATRAIWRVGAANLVAAWTRPAALTIEQVLESSSADPVWRWGAKGLADDRPGARDRVGDPGEVVENEFTGRVSKVVDETTRRREWTDTPVWPVVMR